MICMRSESMYFIFVFYGKFQQLLEPQKGEKLLQTHQRYINLIDELVINIIAEKSVM